VGAVNKWGWDKAANSSTPSTTLVLGRVKNRHPPNTLHHFLLPKVRPNRRVFSVDRLLLLGIVN
jgi:hypothetical protein